MKLCVACGKRGHHRLCPRCRQTRATAEERIRLLSIRIFKHQTEIMHLEAKIANIQRIAAVEYTPYAVSSDRTEAFVALARDGKTLAAIGETFGVSRERVRQVLAQEGLTIKNLRPPKPPKHPKPPRDMDEKRARTRDRQIARLWSKVDRRGPDECWPWLGGTHNTAGKRGVSITPRISVYNNLEPGAKQYGTQPARIVWLLERGPIPAGYLVAHRCNDLMCCNPAHLQLETRSERAQRLRAETGAIPNPNVKKRRMHTYCAKCGSERRRYSSGSTYCPTCKRQTEHFRYHQRKAAKSAKEDR